MGSGRVLIRPPSEAHSLLVEVFQGCNYNQCRFCGIYKQREGFKVLELEEIFQQIDVAKKLYHDYYSTVFLTGSDMTCLPTSLLLKVLNRISETFPRLERITCYSSARSAIAKTPDEFMQLRKAGLRRIHMGLESGSDRILKLMKKGTISKIIVQAGRRIKNAGIEFSLYVLLGLGGKGLTQEHAKETARVLNEADPDFIRFRTLNILANTPLFQEVKEGRFKLLTPYEVIKEQREILASLDVHSEIYNDHVSDYVDFEAKFPEDKPETIRLLDRILEDPRTRFIPPKELTEM
ncbi:MAG: radical SAM protein [Promethearchaeati archaeon SRVP18_Atabeyarchaeia-1]